MHKTLAVLGAVTVFTAAAQSAEFEGADHAYASLLLSTSGADIDAAARALSRRTASPAVFDLAANILYLGCRSERPVPDESQLALVSALGKVGTSRYRDVLTYCATRARSTEVNNAADAVVGAMPNADAAPFIGGSFRLHDVASQLADSVARDVASRPADIAGRVTPGASLSDVYQQLGLPDAVAAQGDGLVAHYGTASIPFVASHEGGWRIPGRAPPAQGRALPMTAAPPPASIASSAPAPPPPPLPAPVVSVPDPKPAPSAPPSPAASAPPVVAPSPPASAPRIARHAFAGGELAMVRPGAVRVRPLVARDVPVAPVAGSVTLKYSAQNADGVWWYVESGGKKGWVLERDLAPN